VRCLFVVAVVAVCLLASSSAGASGGSRASTRTLMANTSHNILGQQDGEGDGEGAKVGEGRRVSAGQLPRTGPNTAEWIALAVASVLLGAGLLAAAMPWRGLGWLWAPLGARLVRAASCGYALEDEIFHVERPRPGARV
jgi:LPXTG-motif cell wall-anchored protein